MTTAIAERESVALTVTAEQLDLVRRTVAKDATADELKLYLYDCARQGAHPLDKLIHFTKRGGKYTPITSIDFMRIRAADTGEYAGNDKYEYVGEIGKPGFMATARVWRIVQGQRVPFEREARWEEYCPPSGQDHMWRKMPHVMLGKCAEAQALRAGFPKQLTGLYAAEEMDQANGKGYAVAAPAKVVDVTTGAEVPVADRPPAPDGFAYLDACRTEGVWTSVMWQGQEYKTKRQQIAAIAEQAYQNGVPVKLTAAKLPWLDAVETFKAPRRAAPDVDNTPVPDEPPL